LTSFAASRTTAGREIHKEEIEHLLEDLESLYSEIYSVAEMSTQNQFLTPILRAINDDDMLLKSISKERMGYV
jgi:hypothetical protein